MPEPAGRTSLVDAVVIGAGHNGLVAANLLADEGLDVLVCEATPHVGGAVRSAEFVAPGFQSDVFSAFYPLSAASPVLANLNLEDHGLQWSHAPSVLAHVLPNDECVVLSRELETTMASVGSFEATDADAWRRLFEEWEQIHAGLIRALFTPLPAVGAVARLVGMLGLSGTLRMARTAVLPVRRFGEESFAGAGAPLLFAGNALHTDLPPEGAASAVYGWLLTMLGQSYGYPVPRGGAGMLTAAMVKRLESRSGSIRTSSAVEQIEVVDGVARGVHLATGEFVRTRRAVIADVAAPILYERLLRPEQLPPGLLRDLANFQWDAPTLKLNWALNGAIPWTAPAARGAGTVHLGVDMDGLTRYAADLATRQFPKQPFVVLGQMTTSDATRSPAGTESAWAYTHVPVSASQDESAIAAHARLVEQTIERHAPGFAELIQAQVVQSPRQLEAENPSLVGGSINGGTSQIHQQLVFRPVPGLGGAATPVDRLFLGSASAHPGGGVHGGPGANAAQAALARDRMFGSGRRRLYQLAAKRLYGPNSARAVTQTTQGARTTQS